MDFTQYSIVEEDLKERKHKVPPRYVLTVQSIFGGNLLFIVEDTFENSIPLRTEAKPSKREYWEKRIKKEYKPLRYESERN